MTSHAFSKILLRLSWQNLVGLSLILALGQLAESIVLDKGSSCSEPLTGIQVSLRLEVVIAALIKRHPAHRDAIDRHLELVHAVRHTVPDPDFADEDVLRLHL